MPNDAPTPNAEGLLDVTINIPPTEDVTVGITAALTEHQRSVLNVASQMLVFEQWGYQHLSQHPDTPEQFKKFYDLFAPMLTAYGSVFAKEIPAPSTPLPRVGFILHGGAALGHSANLITFLIAHAALPAKVIEPYVYLMCPFAPGQGVPFVGAEVQVIEPKPTGPIEHWLRMRAAMEKDQISLAVFVSIPVGMPFAVAAKLAPKHAWWSHKWHGLRLPGLNAYWDSCHPHSPAPVIDGLPWWGIYTALPDFVGSLTPEVVAEAAAIRKSISARIVFGWVGCEEKLFDREFAATVGAILRSVPDSLFLWSAKSAGSPFPDWLDAEGVQGRHGCIGWVNPGLWCSVFDIYLDSFPTGSGHPLFQAWAAGKPVVSRLGVDTHESSAMGMARDLDDGAAGTEAEQHLGKSIFTEHPWTSTMQEYANLAIRLADDDALRERMGSEGKRFLTEVMRDTPRYAKAVCDAALAVINAG